MQGFLTACFSDWTQDSFKRGVMRIINGEQTNYPIRRPLKSSEIEGVDYCIKNDPDFLNFSYSRCHRRLREQLQPWDILFFRTLWRGKQYFIGYFLIRKKIGDPKNPVCLTDKNGFLLVPDFRVEITPEIVKRLNPKASFRKSRHINSQINEWLGRNYLKLDSQRTIFLMGLIQEAVFDLKKLYYKVVTKDLKSVGLGGATPIQYKINEWVYPLEPLSPRSRKGGGLGVLRRRGEAFKLRKYVEENYREEKIRIFLCKIGLILYQSSYRAKTSKVKILEEIY